MATRVMQAEKTHMRLGWSAKSEHKNANWHIISSLSVYEARSQFGERITGISCLGPVSDAVLYLTPVAAIELVKGVLINELERPITLAADEELQQILKQVEVAIKRQDEEAQQILNTLRERNPNAV